MFDVPRETACALVQLFKGVVYRDAQPEIWHRVLDSQNLIRSYCEVLGLQVLIDEAEGYAFLRQQPEPEDDKNPLPRLIPRHHLPFRLSMLLVILRKRLLELDAGGGETRLIVTRESLIESMRLFLPAGDNEVKTVREIDTVLNRAGTDFHLLRRLEGEPPRFEVRRIVKALVDAEVLADVDAKLAEYRELAAATSGDAE